MSIKQGYAILICALVLLVGVPVLLCALFFLKTIWQEAGWKNKIEEHIFAFGLVLLASGSICVAAYFTANQYLAAPLTTVSGTISNISYGTQKYGEEFCIIKVENHQRYYLDLEIKWSEIAFDAEQWTETAIGQSVTLEIWTRDWLGRLFDWNSVKYTALLCQTVPVS